MGTPSGTDQLDEEIFEAMGQLIEGVIAKLEELAQNFGVPAFCVKALQALGAPMAMRDLGRQMHCDPSFVTAIADLLEKRGLARREASTVDRRSKNLVLTDEGMALREQVQQEFMARMPWRSLDDEQRTCLLSLIHKMIRAEVSADPGTTPPTSGGPRAGEVSEPLLQAQPSS
jgi:DNA-binding MarR family transcriptional regulator